MSESTFETDETTPAPLLVDAEGLGPGEDGGDVLRAQVGAVVTGHPGVLRLEPTLLGAVQSLGRGGGLDGIQVVTHGEVVDLDISIATRTDHQARATALDLHEQLTSLVTQHGWVPGSLEISVLRIDEVD